MLEALKAGLYDEFYSLSSNTAEFSSTWWFTLVGSSPFKFESDKLTLEFVHRRIDIYKLGSAKSVLPKTDSEEVKFNGGVIPEPYLNMVRNCLVKSLDVMF